MKQIRTLNIIYITDNIQDALWKNLNISDLKKVELQGMIGTLLFNKIADQILKLYL